jgi:hypothetical protein
VVRFLALRFARVATTNSPEDFHLQVSAHAGHTKEPPPRSTGAAVFFWTAPVASIGRGRLGVCAPSLRRYTDFLNSECTPKARQVSRRAAEKKREAAEYPAKEPDWELRRDRTIAVGMQTWRCDFHRRAPFDEAVWVGCWFAVFLISPATTENAGLGYRENSSEILDLSFEPPPVDGFAVTP